jgi:hypothetical protein
MGYSIAIADWWVGLITYLPFHLLHVAVWRMRPPRRDTHELLLFLFLLPLAVLLIWVGIGGTPRVGPAAILVHFLVAANYLAIYPALQASSPTVHLLCRLRRHPEGLTRETITDFMLKTSAVEARLKDLRNSSLIRHRDGRLELSGAGRLLAAIFLGYRRLLGLERGLG